MFLGKVLGTRLHPKVRTSAAFSRLVRETGIAALWGESGSPRVLPQGCERGLHLSASARHAALIRTCVIGEEKLVRPCSFNAALADSDAAASPAEIWTDADLEGLAADPSAAVALNMFASVTRNAATVAKATAFSRERFRRSG